jgi:hypothetical protein
MKDDALAKVHIQVERQLPRFWRAWFGDVRGSGTDRKAAISDLISNMRPHENEGDMFIFKSLNGAWFAACFRDGWQYFNPTGMRTMCAKCWTRAMVMETISREDATWQK